MLAPSARLPQQRGFGCWVGWCLDVCATSSRASYRMLLDVMVSSNISTCAGTVLRTQPQDTFTRFSSTRCEHFLVGFTTSGCQHSPQVVLSWLATKLGPGHAAQRTVAAEPPADMVAGGHAVQFGPPKPARHRSHFAPLNPGLHAAHSAAKFRHVWATLYGAQRSSVVSLFLPICIQTLDTQKEPLPQSLCCTVLKYVFVHC